MISQFWSGVGSIRDVSALGNGASDALIDDKSDVASAVLANTR